MSNNYQDLLIAVVEQAINDYRKAIVKHEKATTPKDKRQTHREIKEIERFFCLGLGASVYGLQR